MGLIVTFGLVLVAQASTVITKSPGACNGNWSMCQNAFGSDDTYSVGPAPAIGNWYNYGFSISATTTASTTVEVGVEAKVTERCSDSNIMSIAVSQNTGVTYGPAHNVSLTCTDATTWIDVTRDFPTWDATTLADSRFRVRAQCVSGAYCDLDWLPVRVTIP